MEKRRKISSGLIVLFLICNESLAAVLRNPSDNKEDNNNSFTNQLITHAKSKSCFFPFNETDTSGLLKDVDEACFVNSTPPDERKKLCLVFADLIDGICNKTEGYQLKKMSIKAENWTLFKNVLEDENNAPTFCESLIKDTNVPTVDDVRKEFKTFYEHFLSNSDKNTSCASICVGSSAATASKSFKISPVCLIFKYTSGVWKSLEETASSLAQEKGKGQPEVVQDIAIDSTNEINVVKKASVSLPVQSSLPQSNVEENKGNLVQKPDISSSTTTAKDKPASDNYVKAPAENPHPLVVSSSSPSPQIDMDSDNIPPLIVGDKDAEKPKSSTASTLAKAPEKQSPGMESSVSVQDNNKPQQPSVVDKTPTKEEEMSLEDPGDTDYDSKAIFPVSDVGIDDITIPKESNKDDQINKKPNKKPIEEDKNIYRPDAPNHNAKTTFLYKTNDDEESTGYFNYFIFFLTLLALCFLALHNKRRLLAYVIEGRKPRGGRSRRRSASASGASYKRLENNFE